MNFTINKFLKTSLLTLILQFGITTSMYSVIVMPVTQFTNSDDSSTVDVSADNNNNAIAVYNKSFDGIYASYSQEGALWQQGIFIINGDSNPHVAMDATGTALAIGTSGSVYTAYFNGVTWQTPTPDPLYTGGVNSFITDADIAMDGMGKGLGCWSDFDSITSNTNIYASFFSVGSWSTPSPIGTETDNIFGLSAAYSINGNAAAVWNNGGFVEANNFVGSWQGQTVLDATAIGSLQGAPDVGIDASGNAIAIWITSPAFPAPSQVATRRFDGTTWAPAVIFVGSDNTTVSPKIAVAPNGTAVAVWVDSSNYLQMNLFDGTNWGPAIFVGSNSRDPAISMDDAGNALIGWRDFASSQVKAVLFPVGGPLGTTLDIATLPSFFFGSLNVALSDNATTGFIVWNAAQGETTGDTFGTSILFAITPPSDLRANSCKNKFASQTDRVNIITWLPSTDPTVVSYNLSRNGVLIASIPASGPFIYKDHNRCDHSYTYSLVAVGVGGDESAPISTTIN